MSEKGKRVMQGGGNAPSGFIGGGARTWDGNRPPIFGWLNKLAPLFMLHMLLPILRAIPLEQAGLGPFSKSPPLP